MEPERPIEKLLRVFAKKRRDQAGVSWEMPPATRRLLQNEAARRAAKDEESFFATLLALFRRRAAFAVCILAAGLIGAWLLQNNLPMHGTSKSRSIAQRTIGPDSRNEPAAPPPPAIAEQPAPALKPNEPVRGRETVLQKTKANPEIAANDFKQQAPPAAAPASKENADAESRAGPRARSSQLGSPATASGQSPELAKVTNAVATSQTTSLFSESQATKFEIAAGDAANRRTGAASPGGLADGSSIRYYQLADGKRESDVPARVPEKLEEARGNLAMSDSVSTPAKVLGSFTVEQSGGKMRIVDGDGSVYTGVVQPGSPPASTVAAVNSFAPADELRDKKDIGKATSDFYFRVSGTNQSLKRPIVFTGRFLATTNGTQLDSSSAVADGAAGAILKNQPPPRIEGTVLMDDNTKVEIHAAPAGP